MEFIYQVVKLKEGTIFIETEEYTLNQFKNNFEITGFNENHRTRDELQFQPKIAHHLGPMWGGEKDGKSVIRYESYEAYNQLSY